METETTPKPLVNPHLPIELSKLPCRAWKAARLLMFPVASFSRAELATKKLHDLKQLRNCGELTINALRSCLAEAGLKFADQQQVFVEHVNQTVLLRDPFNKDQRVLEVKIVQDEMGLVLRPLHPDGHVLFSLRVSHYAGKISATIVRDGNAHTLVSLKAEEVLRGNNNQAQEVGRKEHAEACQSQQGVQDLQGSGQPAAPVPSGR